MLHLFTVAATVIRKIIIKKMLTLLLVHLRIINKIRAFLYTTLSLLVITSTYQDLITLLSSSKLRLNFKVIVRSLLDKVSILN